MKYNVVMILIITMIFVACSNAPSNDYIEHINLAQEYIDSGDYEAATIEIEKAIKLDDNAPEAFLLKGFMHMTLGELTEAQKALLYVEENISQLVEEGNKYQALLNLGNLYYQKGEFKIGIEYFNKALEKNSQDAELYNAIGLSYMQLGEKVLAKENYTNAIDIDQNNFYAYGNLAALFLEEGKINTGLNEINTAMNINPYVPQFFVIKARLQEANNQIEEAIATYTQAIGLWEDFGDAYYLRGELFMTSSEYLKAIEDFSKAKDYGIVEGLLGMGFAYQGLMQYEDSITAFTEYMINLDAIDLRALYHMAVSYYQLGNYAETINVLDEIIKLEPEDTEALLLKAFAYERKSQYDQAIITLNQILFINPNHSEAKTELEKINNR